MRDKFIHSLDDVREEQEALLQREQDPDFALASDYAVGALSEEKAAEVRARIQRDPAFRDLVDPLLLVAERGPRHEPLPRHELEKRWSALQERIRNTSSDPEVRASVMKLQDARARRRALLLTAASVILMVGLLPAIQPVTRFFQKIEQVVPPGATQIVDLGGGSTATLSSGSRMFQSTTEPDKRLWYVTGDAEFHIVPGDPRPFVAHMGAAEVVVTGTRFHVHGYANEPAEVSVSEGTVQVWGIDEDGVRIGAPISLTVGERARVDRTRLPEKLP
jgi:ferric-dicitrate binding protein FerR (iron transport regulator)